ncbi:hypothetical protein A3A54_02445 [Candidatus Curtissbacteria bacterium RIFCSPLOWO2_01_FULL_39_62]|uniref:Uncharacterized protein n=2 Tax=Candidatus Curtissiibacteriota TaxID=1752717 RepID=A0A1F5GBQ4_9BACT|nr:hypothetical protein [uncultured bacterium]OGD82823.1 MAG: hypothetical protein A2775_01660 [Candidatus Curtissbacteria bacterium RIFCSPHIGHO2_01_FULL_39_57]OGD89288.1 MAG: hypothetical protein A3D04_03655 [Candidatus Curtissbacteria bacterium RIFCSPHIGHO2_02_FULL_40_16b]OGD90935.1 MAG: hypothetical protein A3E11_01760 [Candidatus Curtissbacteria bacterium RIFCSPHIGHO2_12_FULL_38_37]OGD99136.1 MAG: hypothetical protein A3J17_01670 [Candidatus Curtissbacteria bacterium RIFCSPLOWO2_02_FULL_40_
MDEIIKKEGVKHYVCDGNCKGVSLDQDATCNTVDCPKHGLPLQVCTCPDQKHEEVLNKDQKPL